MHSFSHMYMDESVPPNATPETVGLSEQVMAAAKQLVTEGIEGLKTAVEKLLADAPMPEDLAMAIARLEAGAGRTALVLAEQAGHVKGMEAAFAIIRKQKGTTPAAE